MVEKTVMDAMNAALGSAASGDPDENAGAPESTGVPEDEGRTAVDETPPDGEGRDESAVADPEGSVDGDVDSAAKIEDATAASATITTANGNDDRNPDGTFKKKQEEPKKPDAVNDPIPKELKKETRDRMQSLITDIKTKDTELTQVKQNFDYMVNGIQATGATPEQYGETLSWLQLFNSNDPAQQTKALELVESVAERLAMLLGKERKIGDELAQHADLKAAVASKQITQEYAKEIARTRNATGFRTELATSAQQRYQQQQSVEQTTQQARNDLTALEENLRSVDGAQYDAIKAAIVPILKPLMAAISPSQWKAKFTEAYRAEKDRRTSSSTVVDNGVRPKNQPLRGGKNPAGGQARAPANAGEAMNAALASMGK